MQIDGVVGYAEPKLRSQLQCYLGTLPRPRLPPSSLALGLVTMAVMFIICIKVCNTCATP